MNLSMTLIKLLNGESDIVEHYENAKLVWEDIWNDAKSMNVEDLSKLLSVKQSTFEHRCGGELSGKEIMPWSGFAYLLESNGDLEDIERSRRLKEAFAKSYCSLEIKSGARKAVNHFDLEEI